MIDLENFDGQEMLDQVQEKFNKNQNYVYIALAAIALMAGGVWYYMKSNNEKSLQADNMLWKTEFDFARDSFNLAINGGLDEFGMPQGGLKSIVENYSGTDAANIAQYQMGVGYLNMGNFDAAIDALEDVSFEDEILGSIAYGALGDAYYEKGLADKAIGAYKDAVGHSNNTFTAPIYLAKLAAVQEDAKYKEDALESYEKLKKDFPNTAQGRDADRNIARLSN